jgi:hypothetical protein
MKIKRMPWGPNGRIIRMVSDDTIEVNGTLWDAFSGAERDDLIRSEVKRYERDKK